MALVSADELATLLAGEHPPVVVDVRFYLADHHQGRREFDAAHLPGAQFVDLHHDLADITDGGAADGGRHPLPTTTDFGDLLDRLGITPDSTVVVYDNHGGAMASRLWWMLRSVGHRDVRVLDGGIGAWVAANRPLTADIPPRSDSAAAATYPVPPTWTGTIDAVAIGDQPGRPYTLIDSRAPERFRGEHEPLDPRAGHIPGAVNRHHLAVVTDDGYFRSSAELTHHFGDIGVAPVVYCGSGVTACHNLLALHLGGVDDARLYPGSWSEWSSNPDRPVATGSDPT